MRIVKQNRFKNLAELHKEWTEAGIGMGIVKVLTVLLLLSILLIDPVL